MLVFMLTSIAVLVETYELRSRPVVVALIVHGVVTVGIVFWLNLIADVFDLDSSE